MKISGLEVKHQNQTIGRANIDGDKITFELNETGKEFLEHVSQLVLMGQCEGLSVYPILPEYRPATKPHISNSGPFQVGNNNSQVNTF